MTPASPLTPHTKPLRSDSMRGIAYMALGMFLFAAVDTHAKFLTQSLSALQIVWIRQLGLLVGVLIVLAVKGPVILKTANLPLQTARGVLAVSSATLFIIAVTHVPLVDAVAVSFVAPFMVTALGALVLGEAVGIRRWIAVTIGFLGTLIIIRPGMGVIHPTAMLVIVAAFFFALRQILSRFLGGSDPTVTTVAYTALVGSALLTLPLPFVWTWPETRLEITLLISMATLAAVAEFFVIRALEVAQAVIVAPVHYTMLLWGTMYGFLVFSQLPDIWTLTGATIIVVTGLYTLNRERLAARRRSAAG